MTHSIHQAVIDFSALLDAKSTHGTKKIEIVITKFDKIYTKI